MTLFEFSDYRSFLRAWIKALPKAGRGEINKLANHLCVNPTLISQTLAGTRNFTDEQAFATSKYIGLNAHESEFFELLIRIEKTGSTDYKKHLKTKLERMRADSSQLIKRVRHDGELSDVAKATFYSSYIYSSVRLFCSIGQGKTVAEVAERFSLARSKANEVLRFLADHELCTEGKNRFRIGPLITHLEATSDLISRHHTNWRVKSIQKSENVLADELLFSGPFSISRADFAKVRENLMNTIAEISSKVRASDSEDIACLNVDLFWIDK